VQRPDLVPDLSVTREIAVGGLGTFGADRFGTSRVGSEQCLGRPVSPLVNQREQRVDALRFGERQEYPAALLAALQYPRIGEDLQVARDARLALPENLRQLSDRQLHQPQQRDDAQPSRIGKRLESVSQG